MKLIKDQLQTLTSVLKHLESKITKLELSKIELEKAQKNLDSLDNHITSENYVLSDDDFVNMWELQAVINYARGDLKSSQSIVKEVTQRYGQILFKTKIVNEIADGLVNNIASTDEVSPTIDSRNIPHYFTVSTSRMVILGIFTLSLYLGYWSYKNWKVIQDLGELNKKGKKIRTFPILSSIFFPATAYELFARVRKSSEQLGIETKISAGNYGWGVFLLNLPRLSFLPVIGFQKYMNEVKKVAFGDEGIRKGTSIGEVIFVILTLGINAGTISLYNSNLTSYSSTNQSPAIIANQAAQEVKSSTQFPYQIDDVTNLTDITADGGTIQYYYTIHDADISKLSDEYLRSNTLPSVCSNNDTKKFLDGGVNFKYIYTVKETNQQFSFTITKSDCLINN